MSQNRARVPQDAKVKPPNMPDDRFASQKYQDPLATMPRISNPEAMSNDRGPAAEGVAHKITSCGYLGTSGTIWSHLVISKQSGAIWKHMVPSGTIQGYLEQS